MKILQLKTIVIRFVITAIFNTVIALVLNFVVIEDPVFFQTFVISQLIGLSICLCVSVANYINATDEWNITHSFTGLLSGIFLGSILVLIFLFLFYGNDFSYFFNHVFLYVFVFGIIFGIPISYFFSSREKIIASEKRIQNEKIKRLTLEKETAMTTLRLLQAQIEPHFLFNTLSNVISLFDIDTQKARQMLIDFNEYLRISLQRTRREMITLTQELDLTRQYLAIFKIRMGDRLAYEIHDKTDIAELPFPPLIIQPLVENSIKYGIEPKVSGGNIAIICNIEKGNLKIVITDTGDGLDKNANKAGIGINNVSRRLENIYGSKAGLVLKQNYPTGMKAVIRVPI